MHILVNNAGGVLGQVGRPLEEVTPAEWQAIFDVNVTGAFYCSQAVAPGMKAARFGRIINISSGAGLGVSLTGIQAYASAKAAQIGLTRQLAHELGPWGITVNNIAPGFVRSNPTTERQWQSYGAEKQRALVESIALKRLGTPEDIAAGVLFFASEYGGLDHRPGAFDRRRQMTDLARGARAPRGRARPDPRGAGRVRRHPERQHRSRARGRRARRRGMGRREARGRGTVHTSV